LLCVYQNDYIKIFVFQILPNLKETKAFYSASV
jgi:hypothetical protein